MDDVRDLRAAPQKPLSARPRKRWHTDPVGGMKSEPYFPPIATCSLATIEQPHDIVSLRPRDPVASGRQSVIPARTATPLRQRHAFKALRQALGLNRTKHGI